MYLLQREQRRVMQADQAMMDILSKVMPYKVSNSPSRPPCLCHSKGAWLSHIENPHPRGP